MANQDRNQEYYFNLWKHFEDAGGEDKNRMINLATWLLAFIAAIIGYIFKNANRLSSGEMIALSVTGLLISLLAMYVVYIFSFYANFNWKAAEKIEELNLKEIQTMLNKLDKRYQATTGKMAPPFKIFFGVSILLAIGFLALIIMNAKYII